MIINYTDKNGNLATANGIKEFVKAGVDMEIKTIDAYALAAYSMVERLLFVVEKLEFEIETLKQTGKE